MKKLLLFVLLFISAEVTFGQFAFGVKVGYNASKLSTNLDTIKSSFNSGFHIGAFARIGNRLHLQPEFYYTLSGGKFDFSSYSAAKNWTQQVTVGTLDIPVLIGYKIIKTELLSWRVMAGPELSLVVNSKIKNVTNTGYITTSDISKVNWYIQVGTGIDVLFLTLDVRYQIGLNKIIDNFTAPTGGPVYPVNSKGNMFVISVGFKIL